MLHTKGGMTISEIGEQPNLWQQAVKLYNKERETLIWIKKMKFNQVIFIGEGASYYASLYAASIFRDIGKIYSLGLRSSEIFLGEALPFHPLLRTLIIPISRTGQTHETIWALEKAKKLKQDIQVLSLTCDPNSPIAQKSDKIILLEGIMDEVPVPIKSFSTSLFLLALIAGALGGNTALLGELSRIPKTIDMKHYHDFFTKIRGLKEAKSLFFLGSGFNAALAGYGALITKMMCLEHSQYMDAFEFRHNQYITINSDMMGIFIMNQSLLPLEVDSLRDAAKMKAKMLLLTEDVDEKYEALAENAIKFKSGLSPYALAFYVIPCLQYLAFQTTIVLGRNPDKPKNIVEIVTYKNPPV